MSRDPLPCDVPAAEHNADPTRLYPCGWRCDLHAPWALNGQPEPQPGPGWPSRRTEAATTDDENGTP
jgi:hypothetical protein